MLFDNFYDTVEFRKQKGSVDEGGRVVPSEPQTINVRYIKGTQTFEQSSGSIHTVFRRLYHVSPDVEIEDGDILDGYKVKEVMPSKDINGKLYFWKVWCE